jgi:hypothetical protein
METRGASLIPLDVIPASAPRQGGADGRSPTHLTPRPPFISGLALVLLLA